MVCGILVRGNYNVNIKDGEFMQEAAQEDFQYLSERFFHIYDMSTAFCGVMCNDQIILNISGGRFSGSSNGVSLNFTGHTERQCTVNISGGYFYGESGIGFESFAENVINVYGGYFGGHYGGIECSEGYLNLYGGVYEGEEEEFYSSVKRSPIKILCLESDRYKMKDFYKFLPNGYTIKGEPDSRDCTDDFVIVRN